jgi:hypothetical protein
VKDFNIFDILSFSLPLSPPLSSIVQFHYYQHILMYTWSHLIFMDKFFFWLYLPLLRESLRALSF